MSNNQMIEHIIAGLNGAPDNRDARLALQDLEEAGLFFRYDCDGTLDSFCRLGVLTLDGKRFWVQREADDWRSIKLWQIKVVPIN